jgi:hypothetical protein
MEFEVPKRHILRPTLCIDMIKWVYVVGEAKEVLWEKKYCDD